MCYLCTECWKIRSSYRLSLFRIIYFRNTINYWFIILNNTKITNISPDTIFIMKVLMLFWKSFRMHLASFSSGFTLHSGEAIIYLSLTGSLCSFGLQYMQASFFISSSNDKSNFPSTCECYVLMCITQCIFSIDWKF